MFASAARSEAAAQAFRIHHAIGRAPARNVDASRPAARPLDALLAGADAVTLALFGIIRLAVETVLVTTRTPRRAFHHFLRPAERGALRWSRSCGSLECRSQSSILARRASSG